MSKLFVSHSLDDTALFGKSISKELATIGLPVIVLLKGPFGAGKTTLIKSVISELAGVAEEEISSPTFQYVSLYTSKIGIPIAHFDLWRLSDVEAFLALGLDEILHSSLSFVEWPERLEGVDLSGSRLITIEAPTEGTRSFTWDVV